MTDKTFKAKLANAESCVFSRTTSEYKFRVVRFLFFRLL